MTDALARIPSDSQGAAVNLYWLPLGAGGHSVAFNGRLYEAAAALIGHRATGELYHSALEVRVPEGRYVIEQAPVPDNDCAKRGVVAGGAVGTRWAGRLRIFRYELRRWHDGAIPDIADAVESPQLLTTDVCRARRVLDLAPSVPTLVWGRDELGAGEMWNSNSFISWLLERSGVNTASIHPPAGGRAPGWHAGLVIARRAGSAQANTRPRAREKPPAGERGIFATDAVGDADIARRGGCHNPEMARSYRLTEPRRILNALVRALLRVGIAPPGTYLLTVRGRSTGTPYSTPVTLVEEEDGRWLVAPYGEVGWVRNARAAGYVQLTRGRRSEQVQIDEIYGDAAATILQKYVRDVRVVRSYFDAAPDSPLTAFAAETARHPVFSIRAAQTAL